jgi:o-succinylbenzoate synthase
MSRPARNIPMTAPPEAGQLPLPGSQGPDLAAADVPLVIEEVRIHHVRMPLIQPWRTSFGAQHSIDSVLVGLVCDGRVQWGEAAPGVLPLFCPEWGEATYALLRDVIGPRVVGRDLPTARDLAALWSDIRGNYFAKAAVDNAWWALRSAVTSTPLARLLGADDPGEIPVGADFDIGDRLDRLVDAVGAAVDSGCPRVKLKIRRGWDLQVVAAVRSTFPELVFHVDCNGGYTLDDLDLFTALDEFGLALIEQPLAFDDLYDHARLQSVLRTPVCLDESIGNVGQFRSAVALSSCRFLNLKPGRVGGLTESLAILDAARQAGIRVFIGNMLESSVGSFACLALASLPGMDYPADLFPRRRFFARDLGLPPLEIDDRPGTWYARCPQTAGCPVVPDEGVLADWTVASSVLTPDR